MHKLTPLNSLYIVLGTTLSMALSACADIKPDNTSALPAAKVKSFAAAKTDVPMCYATRHKNMDSVVVMKKDNTGDITGKTFGIKKAPNTAALQPFEQQFEGRFVNETRIDVDVRTEFDGARTKRRDIITLKGDSILFGKETLDGGKCKKLINDFLDRNMDRRRQAEQAALDVF